MHFFLYEEFGVPHQVWSLEECAETFVGDDDNAPMLAFLAAVELEQPVHFTCRKGANWYIEHAGCSSFPSYRSYQEIAEKLPRFTAEDFMSPHLQRKKTQPEREDQQRMKLLAYGGPAHTAIAEP